MSAANIYETGGKVVGYLTAGADQTHISGVVDKNTYGGALVGKAVVIPHVNGSFYLVMVDVTTPAVDPQKVVFTGHTGAIAVNFVPKPFSSLASAVQSIANDLNSSGGDTGGTFPIWPVAAVGGVALLLLLRD
jgi:hypothetical protein